MDSSKIRIGWVGKCIAKSGLVFLCVLGVSSAAWANTIGEVVAAKGKATSASDQRATIDLTKGSPIYKGDVLETVGRSFLVVKFNDGGKVVLRPNSRFEINEYNDTPGQEKEEFKLVKGALRAVTGAIGKNRPENVAFTASNTTMGIRGTTFVIKICDRTTDACAKSTDDTQLSEDEKGKLQDLFLTDKSTGNPEKVERTDLSEVLEGLFVQVEEGGVRVNVDGKYLDLEPGGACAVGKSGTIECFFKGLDLSGFDVFVSNDSAENGAASNDDEDEGEGGKSDGQSDGSGANASSNRQRNPLSTNLGVNTTPGAGASPTN
ncbi:hypothetical protein NBRC116583_18130 [Arenicella sp. 4NH20-0111]|uniref:FecR family protein n=1 Tax=Arenicella sp. 4NH20-0111 TaxID=3127648 RepID=UPI00310A200D